jgi:hypothetical protein
MSSESVLPYDIIAEIIDNVGENDDMDLIKELSLVSHSFNQICSKHLFATVDLYSVFLKSSRQASSKKGFVKLLKRRPDIVKHIRKLIYRVDCDDRFPSSSFYESSTYPCLDYDDNLLSPVLPNLLRTISFLRCLTITASKMVNWNTMDSSLTSAFLHLLHLPTINHIDLSSIENIPLSSLIASECVNLRRLDMHYLRLEDGDSPDIDILPGVLPKIREFNISHSSQPTTKLLRAKTQDGRPAFNLMDLRRLSITSIYCFKDDWNLQYLLQNATLLEKLYLSVASKDALKRLHDILSPSARTLKELDLIVSLYSVFQPLGLCAELEAMAGNNMLEVFSFGITAEYEGIEAEEMIGSMFQRVEEILVKPGWFALRRVSFKVSIPSSMTDFFKALQSLPDRYLSHLSKLESVAFNYECIL